MPALASPSARRPRAWARAGMGALAAVVLLALAWRGGGSGEAADGEAVRSDDQVAAVQPSPSLSPPDSTQAAVATPPPSATLLASSKLPTLPMRQALALAAADLRRCSTLAGGLLVVEFMTVSTATPSPP
jgi:hypothetical protein